MDTVTAPPDPDLFTAVIASITALISAIGGAHWGGKRVQTVGDDIRERLVRVETVIEGIPEIKADIKQIAHNITQMAANCPRCNPSESHPG